MANISISEIQQEISNPADLDGNELFFVSDPFNNESLYTSKKCKLSNIKSYIDVQSSSSDCFGIAGTELSRFSWSQSGNTIRFDSISNHIQYFENCIIYVSFSLSDYNNDCAMDNLSNCIIMGQYANLSIFDSGSEIGNLKITVSNGTVTNHYGVKPKENIIFIVKGLNDSGYKKAKVINGQWVIDNITVEEISELLINTKTINSVIQIDDNNITGYYDGSLRIESTVIMERLENLNLSIRNVKFTATQFSCSLDNVSNCFLILKNESYPTELSISDSDYQAGGHYTKRIGDLFVNTVNYGSSPLTLQPKAGIVVIGNTQKAIVVDGNWVITNLT